MTDRELKWAARLLGLAEHIAQWSKDPSSKVGCVLADQDFRILSTGFNGFASRVKDLDSRLADRETKLGLVIHAEENATLFARASLVGAGCYVTHPPCSRCAAKLIQAGISLIAYRAPSKGFTERWGRDIELSKEMYLEANVTYYELP